MKVEIPAYSDRWMMGDRFGVVLGAYMIESGENEGAEAFRVKLDISGKVRNYLADDCRVL